MEKDMEMKRMKMMNLLTADDVTILQIMGLFCNGTM
jgi:hypothetical protein